MRTTTYRCDRCGKEEKDAPGSLKEVRVGYFEPGFRNTRSGQDDCYRRAEWCHDCLAETGLWIPQNRDSKWGEKVPDEPPSLEEMVRQIVRQERDDDRK